MLFASEEVTGKVKCHTMIIFSDLKKCRELLILTVPGRLGVSAKVEIRLESVESGDESLMAECYKCELETEVWFSQQRGKKE